MSLDLVYNPTHQVVVCRRCQTCLVPRQSSIERHLRGEPHRLLGPALKAHLAYIDGLTLRDLETLKRDRPRESVDPIEYLPIHAGFRCLLCPLEDPFYTIRLPRIRDHIPSHDGRSAREHKSTPLWESCRLQTYFANNALVTYFAVLKGVETPDPAYLTVLTEPERELFVKLEGDYQDVKCDLEAQASIVRDIRESRSERVPWLHDVTRFPSHIVTLQDEEIWSSYRLPPKKELDAGGEHATDPDLARILVAAEAVLRDAYRLYSDTSPDRKMTQQRANILNEFYTGASGKADGFRYYKNASTLVTYFTTMKQLLVYYYRVVYCESGHFTRVQLDQILPGDVIQPTTQQIQAMDKIIDALVL
ncbi:hypothetical protein BKA64DRAFT_581999, partial [Cadophora sp. MPI-SDFR-AT-0126]